MDQTDTDSPTTLTPNPGDWPLHVRSRLIVMGIGIVAFVFFQLLSLAPGLVEVVYATTVGPLIAQPLSRLTGLFPFSIVELCVVAYMAWLGVLSFKTVRAVAGKRRNVSNAVLGGGLRLARDAGVYVALFYFLWGLNYARRPLDERLEWPAWTQPEVEVLRTLAEQSVEAANQAYFEIHGTEDVGNPTGMPRDAGDLDRALEDGWAGAAELLDLPASTRRRYGQTKRLLFSHLIARLGIAGFYFPWTAEANVLRDSPVVSRSQSMAHEKAHQRGIGPESEASFLGYVAGTLAPHAHARYSALVFAQGQLLRVLARADREAAREVVANRFPGIRRDLQDLSEYWEQFQGVGTTIGRAVNDRYLRTNRVRAGVQSYGLSVRLLITFAEQHDGAVVPHDGRTEGL